MPHSELASKSLSDRESQQSVLGTNAETDTELHDQNPVTDADSEIENDIGKRVDVVDIDTNMDTDLFIFKSLLHYSIIHLCLRVDELTRDVLDVYQTEMYKILS